MSNGAKRDIKTAPAASSRSRKPLPSAKLNQRTVNPFSRTTSQSVFESVYAKGGIPCRLMHGSVKHKLNWDIPKEKVSFDPLLITLAEGLRETRHPYTFVSVEGFKELMLLPDANDKTLPLLPKLGTSIKLALTSKDSGSFDRGLVAVTYLSDCVKERFDPILKILMTCLARRMSADRKKRSDITAVLQKLETNGGDGVLLIIKSKVPTYYSVYA